MYTTLNSINHELLRCIRNYRIVLREIDNLNKSKSKDENINKNIELYQKELYNLRSHIRYLVYLSRAEGVEFPEDKLLTLLKGYANGKRI